MVGLHRCPPFHPIPSFICRVQCVSPQLIPGTKDISGMASATAGVPFTSPTGVCTMASGVMTSAVELERFVADG